MTQDEIIRMAREAGFTDYYPERLTRFFNLAFAAGVNHGREGAARVCDEYADKCVEAENWEAEDVSLHCARAIRNLIK